jgi:hypothetical protein
LTCSGTIITLSVFLLFILGFLDFGNGNADVAQNYFVERRNCFRLNVFHQLLKLLLLYFERLVFVFMLNCRNWFVQIVRDLNVIVIFILNIEIGTMPMFAVFLGLMHVELFMHISILASTPKASSSLSFVTSDLFST